MASYDYRDLISVGGLECSLFRSVHEGADREKEKVAGHFENDHYRKEKVHTDRALREEIG